MNRLEYTYDESQVRKFSEGVTTLTPLELELLDRLDEAYLYIEELGDAMQRVIETEYGDALVEFIRYDEDGNIVNEITGIYLPEFGVVDCKQLKEQITAQFYNGEGYNL